MEYHSNNSKHSRDLDEDYEGMMEYSIKKLKVGNSDPVSILHHQENDHPSSFKPLMKRFPSAEEGECDVNYPVVNQILRELAVIRDFRFKMQLIRTQSLHTIFEGKELTQFDVQNEESEQNPSDDDWSGAMEEATISP
jgi:hypothetical protein